MSQRTTKKYQKLTLKHFVKGVIAFGTQVRLNCFDTATSKEARSGFWAVEEDTRDLEIGEFEMLIIYSRSSLFAGLRVEPISTIVLCPLHLKLFHCNHGQLHS